MSRVALTKTLEPGAEKTNTARGQTGKANEQNSPDEVVFNGTVHVPFVASSSSQFQLIVAIHGVDSAWKIRNFYLKIQICKKKRKKQQPKNPQRSGNLTCSSMAGAKVVAARCPWTILQKQPEGTGPLFTWPCWGNLSNGVGQMAPRRGWCSKTQTLCSLMSFRKRWQGQRSHLGCSGVFSNLCFLMRNSASSLL